EAGGRASKGLLLQDLNADLLHAVEERAQRALLSEKHLQQADLQLEVVVVRGHDLDSAGRGVEKLAVRLGRRAERLLDQDDIAQVVVGLERGDRKSTRLNSS